MPPGPPVDVDAVIVDGPGARQGRRGIPVGDKRQRAVVEHDVHEHRGGVKQIWHPVVGRLELMYDTLPVAQAPGLTMLVYTAPPGPPTADALQLLASWAATRPAPVAPSPAQSTN